MNPQHSSPAPAVLRWRDGLQVKFCADYSIMHVTAFNKRCSMRINSLGVGYIFDSKVPWIVGTQIDDPSSLYPAPGVTGFTPLKNFLFCRRSASKQCSPPDKQQIFNRMNGSPGDPPGNHMHKFKPKRITPFIHRLASDPVGMEADRETLT